MTRAQQGAPAPGQHRGLTRVRFREGYKPAEVDAFLARADRTMKTGKGSLVAREVGSIRFTTVRLRSGYEMAAVDDALDRVTAALVAREHPGVPSPPSRPRLRSGVHARRLDVEAVLGTRWQRFWRLMAEWEAESRTHPAGLDLSGGDGFSLTDLFELFGDDGG